MLVTLTDPFSAQSEAYRTLRTNLSFYSLDEPLRTLVVTSAAPDEESSIAAANLAVTMAQSGRKTCLVECDLRRPSLHNLLAVKQQPGLTNTLISDDQLPITETTVENLWVLPGGAKPPNPADLLGSRKLDQVIQTLLEQVDIVLFTAPPVNVVTDATILGAKVDGVLLVINSGKTRRDQAQRATEILAKANVRIVGATVVNATDNASLDTYN